MAKKSTAAAAPDDDHDHDQEIEDHVMETKFQEVLGWEEGLQWKLTKAMRQSAEGMNITHAMYMFKGHERHQKARISTAGQCRELIKSGSPDDLVVWMHEKAKMLEEAFVPLLSAWAKSFRVGAWLRSVKGVGPLLGAAMIACFDISKAPTVGHFWRYAGLDPTLIWLGKKDGEKLLKQLGVKRELTDQQALAIHEASGQHLRVIIDVFNNGLKLKGKLHKGVAGLEKLLARRPWNADLKSICLGRLGESFVKLQDPERYKESVYGPLFAAKKAELWQQNLAGEFVEHATITKENLKSKTTGTYAWKDGKISPSVVKKALSKKKTGDVSRALAAISESKGGGRGCQPMLPPGQIHDRARRWAVKLFISHMHHCMHEDYFGVVPVCPYVFAYPKVCGEHAHMLLPPNWPGDHSGRSLRDLRG